MHASFLSCSTFREDRLRLLRSHSGRATSEVVWCSREFRSDVFAHMFFTNALALSQEDCVREAGACGPCLGALSVVSDVIFLPCQVSAHANQYHPALLLEFFSPCDFPATARHFVLCCTRCTFFLTQVFIVSNNKTQSSSYLNVPETGLLLG